MDDLRLAIAEAIRKLRAQVQWKPGKDVGHLQKRKAMGHLPMDTSMENYSALIQSVVQNPEAKVYLYRLGGQPYVAVRGNVTGRAWLTIFSLAGIMETAFPPQDIDGYLAQPGFAAMGTIEELLG